MLLFHFLASVVFSWSPILNSLEDLQFQSGETIAIALSTYIVGNNLTFALSGNFTTLEGNVLPDLPAPSLHQRLTHHTRTAKPYPSLSNGQIGFVSDPSSDSVYFNAAGSFVYAWNLQTVTYLGSFAATGSVVGIYAISASGSCTVLVLSYKKQQVVFEAAAFVQELGFFPDEGFKVYFAMASAPLGTYIEKRKSYFYAYIWGQDAQGSGLLTTYRISLSSAQTVIKLNSLTAASLSLPGFSPVGFTTLDSNGILCDQENGVLVLDVARWVKSSGRPIVYSRFSDPTYYGRIVACSLAEDTLYVTTEKSQLVYAIEELGFGGGDQIWLVCEFTPDESEESRHIASATGLLIAPDLGLIASVLQYANSSDFSLRVLNNNNLYFGNGFITLEASLCSLGLDSCVSPPAYTILPFKDYQARLVVDTLSSIQVFTLWMYAELLIEADITSTYRYIGEIQVDRAGEEIVKVPFSLIAWDAIGNFLYTTRNTTPDSGFTAPTEVIHKLNSMDGLATVIYLPLSNYFSGHLVQYSLSLLPSPSNANLTYPAPVALNSTYVFPAVQAAPFLSSLQFAEFTLLAVLSSNQITLFDASSSASLTPLSSLSPSQPGYSITQCTTVIQLFSSVTWVVVESERQIERGYAYIWDIFNVSRPEAPNWTASVTMESVDRFGKLQGRDQLLFSQRTDSIFVGEIQENNGNTVFISLHSVTATSAQIPSLHPVDFTVDFGDERLYVYDQHYGLIQFLPSTSGMYVGNLSGIPLSPSPHTVRLYLHDSLLMLLDPASLSNTVIDYSADYRIIGSFPLLPDSAYISASIAFNVLAIFANTPQGKGLLLFDREAEAFRSIIAFLPISEAYALVAVEGDFYHAFGYDGVTLTRWSIGQRENGWLPSSEWVPATCLERTVWAKLTFSFATLINQAMYEAAVVIQATSGLGGAAQSTTVKVSLVNTGSYIRLAEEYTGLSPLISGEAISLANDTLEMPVPLDFFLGSDLTFAFILNENIALPLKPQVTCNPASALVCISAKQYLCEDCPSAPDSMPTVLAFLMTPHYTYFASYNLIIRQSSDSNLTFAMEEIREMNVVVCYLLGEVEGAEDLVVVAGVEVKGAYSGQFLLLLNSTDISQSLSFELSTMLLTIEAAQEDGEIRIFASDISRIFVLTASNGTLALSSIISRASLNINAFSPTSVEYLNRDFILVADCYTGLFALQRSNETADYSIWQVVEGFKGFNESGVAALALSPDSLSLYVLSRSTALSQFSLYSPHLQVLNLTLVTTIAPVAEDLETYLISDVLTIDPSGRFIAFPFYDGTYCRVRVVDLQTVLILTSTDSLREGRPDDVYMYGSVAIHSALQASFTLTVALAFSFAETVFTSFTIRPQSTAYIFPQENTASSNKLISLQLEAFNSLSKAVAPIISVNFTA